MISAPPTLPSSRLDSSFYREAGKACARYLQNGGRLREIDIEKSQLLQRPLQLTPVPTGKRALFPDRQALESDLEDMWIRWQSQHAVRPGNALRFLCAFSKEMSRTDADLTSWARVWLRGQTHLQQLDGQVCYQTFLEQPGRGTENFTAHWESHPHLEAGVLHAILIENLHPDKYALSQSRRAVVIKGELLGLPVIIKRYAANPHAWKQRWEVSRARRAWAAAKVLEELGLPAMRGLGWLEHHEKGRLKESFFISQQLPEMETLRTWLRREFPKMHPHARVQFRHRLRQEILKLPQYGLAHVDLKLSNLLVQGPSAEDLRFYWIDLEDLRPNTHPRRTFVRNLYQLNGSLPRQIPLEERKAFVAGFQRAFPFATSARLLRYVQRKTRRRHQDELKRLQGA